MKKAAIVSLIILIFFSACSLRNGQTLSADKDISQTLQQNAAKETGLFPIIDENDKWGYVDNTGKVAIKPQFEFAGDFSEGYALIQKDGGFGYMDENGIIKIEPRFNEAYSFSEGRAAFLDDDSNKFGYIDKAGRTAIEPEFDEAGQFREGLAFVGVGNKYGFIDKSGKMVIKPKFDFAYDFSGGLAHVISGNKSAYIDKHGKYVIKPSFAGDSSGLGPNGNFSNGLAPAADDFDSKWGYIGRNGKYAIAPIYDNAADFSEGLAAVKKDGVYGYIDVKGNSVIKPQFEEAYTFSEGLAMVKIAGSGYCYIDKAGAMVTKPIFDRAQGGVMVESKDFSGGIARVLGENFSWGYINKSGEFIWRLDDPQPASSAERNGQENAAPVERKIKLDKAWELSEISEDFRPTVAGDDIFVLSRGLCSVNRSTGRVNWSTALDGPLVDSIITDSGAVAVCGGNGVNLIDGKTGGILWSFDTRQEIYSAPAKSGGTLYFTASEGMLYANEYGTGKEIWKFRYDDNLSSYDSMSNPVPADGMVIYSSGLDRSLYAVDAITHELRWRHEDIDADDAELFSDGSSVYLVSGRGCVYAFSAGKGTLEWFTELDAEPGGSCLASNGNMYISSLDGRIFSVDLSDGHIVFGRDYGSMIGDIYAAKDLLFFTNYNDVASIDLSGDGYKTYDTGCKAKKLAMDDSELYITTVDGRLVKFKITYP